MAELLPPIVSAMTHRTWPTKPSQEEAVEHALAFFEALRSGELERAEAMVPHAYEDWNENVFNLFQDHYLIHTTPPDSSFEGGWWRSNRGWLADFSVDGPGEWMGKAGNVLWLSLAYRGEPSGYVAEFQIVPEGEHFVLQHNAFRMA